MLAGLSTHLTTIRSLKHFYSQEHMHFMRGATMGLEQKIDDGFQVCFFRMNIMYHLKFGQGMMTRSDLKDKKYSPYLDNLK